EIGLLHDFLGLSNPESPLYGRHYIEIEMSRFNPEEAETFLKEGFKQINLACSNETIAYAVEKLDGVAGWLTLFGARCRDKGKCSKETADEVQDEGGRLARREALELVKFSTRYGVILNYLSSVKKANWAKVKTAVEVHEKRPLPSSNFTEVLNKLVKTSLVEKQDSEYHIADPLLAHGIAKEPFKQ
ncbi:MAG TPA: ATP-binding protein, partial [Candidatus Hodarchaeales archaeon]|nr:ATP-binding protein [Candidatus Hodarchaeales archaeon]